MNPWFDLEASFILNTKAREAIQEPGYDPPVKQLEIQYDSFVAFDKIVEELRLSLIKYQIEHESLEAQQYVYEGTNAPIDFSLISEAVTQARAEIKEFLVWNRVDLKNEQIAFGWRTDSYPALAYIRLPQKGEPELGQGKLRRTGGHYKVSAWHFLWKGFARLEKLDYLNDVTTATMFRHVDTITSGPRLAVKQFVDAYPGAFSELKSKKPDTVKSHMKFFDQFGKKRKPKTFDEVQKEEELTLDKSFKYALSTRARSANDLVADQVFAALPYNVDKIRTLDDLYPYVLNRVDIPTLAYKLLECYGSVLSLDDVIDGLCDEFLKEIGADPKQIDKFFKAAETKNIELEGFTFIHGAEVMQSIKDKMGQFIAQGVDDPFYKAVIESTADEGGRRWVCEIILVSMFSLGALFYEALSREPDPDKEDPIPAVKKRDTTFKWPWPIPKPWLASLLDHVARKLEDLAYAKLEELVWKPVNEVLMAFVEKCEDQSPGYGELMPEDLFPVPETREVLADRFAGTDVADPEEFLGDLFGALTKDEICTLFTGTASAVLIARVQSLLQSRYPTFYALFSTQTQTQTFFKNLGPILDLSACYADVPNDNCQQLEDLCLEGETLRETAIRESLRQKGLTPEEIDAQIELDKALAKEQLGNIANMIVLGTSEPRSIFEGEGQDGISFFNSLIAEAESLDRQTGYALAATLEPIKSSFAVDIASFIPMIFDEINKLRDLGYDIEKLPFSELIGTDHTFSRGVVKHYRAISGGANSWDLYSPRLNFIPGVLDADPYSPTYGQWIPGSAHVETIGSRASEVALNWGHVNVNYSILPPISGFVDAYNLTVSKVTGTNAAGFYIGDALVLPKTGLAKTVIIPTTLTTPSSFAGELLTSADARDENVPHQVQLFKLLLSWSITRGGSFSDGVVLPSHLIDGSNPGPIDTLLSDLKDNESSFARFLTEENPSLCHILYDKIIEKYNEEISVIISESEYFGLQKLREINFLQKDLLELIGLDGLKEGAKKRAGEFLSQIDFENGEEPTHLADAAFEAALKAAIRLYTIEIVMSCIFVFSRFRGEDAFSDPLIAEFIKQKVQTVPLPNGSTLAARHSSYIEKLETKLKNRLSKDPATKNLTNAEIEQKIAEDIYGTTAENITSRAIARDELLNKEIMEVFKPAGDEPPLRKKLENILDLKLPALEEAVLKNEDKPFEQVELEDELAPVIDSIKPINAEIDWHGKGEEWRNAKKVYMYIGSEDFSANHITELAANADISERKHTSVAKTWKSWPGNENWALTRPSTAASTCLREYIPDPTDAGSVLPVEIPQHVLLPPGTAYDPGDVISVPLPGGAEIEELVAVIDNWGVFVNADLAAIQNDGQAQFGVVPSMTTVVEHVANLLGDYNRGELDPPSEGYGGGFIEHVLGMNFPHRKIIAPNVHEQHALSNSDLQSHSYTTTAPSGMLGQMYPDLLQAFFFARSHHDAPIWSPTRQHWEKYRDLGAYFLREILEYPDNQDIFNNPTVYGTTPSSTMQYLGAVEKLRNPAIIAPIWSRYGNEPQQTEFQTKIVGDATYKVVQRDIWLPQRFWIDQYNAQSATDPTPIGWSTTPSGAIPLPIWSPRIEWVKKLNMDVLIRVRNSTSVGRNENRAIEDSYGRNEGDPAFFAGDMGPQTKEEWNALNEAASPGDASSWPVIQIRPPVYHFWAGSSDKSEIFVPEVKKIVFWIGGSNFVDGAKAYLQPAGNALGPSYPFDVKYITADRTAMKVEMPIEVHHGHQVPGSPTTDYHKNNFCHGPWTEEEIKAKGESLWLLHQEDIAPCGAATGQILKMNGQEVAMNNIFVLIVENPGFKKAAAPLYFHTFNQWDHAWYNSGYPDEWTDRNIQFPLEQPATPSNAIFFGETSDEQIGQAYHLPLYGDRRLAWDIFDVADIWGEEKDTSNLKYGSQTLDGKRYIPWCKPRIYSESISGRKRNKLSKNGGFILEKYIKLKFKRSSGLYSLGSPGSAKRDAGKHLARKLYEFETWEEEGNYSSHTHLRGGVEHFEHWIGVTGDLGEGAIKKRLAINRNEDGAYPTPWWPSSRPRRYNEILLPYAAFIRLLGDFVGFDAGELEEEEIGYQYTIHNPSGVNLGQLVSPAPTPRIVGNVEDFVDDQREADPYAEYEVQYFSQKIKGNLLTSPLIKKNVILQGVKVVKRILPPQMEITEGGEDEQALRDLVLNGKWSDILEDVGFGLRLSYVFPEKMWSGYGNSIKEGGLSTQLKAALNPWTVPWLGDTGFQKSGGTNARTAEGDHRVPVADRTSGAYRATRGMYFCHKTHHFKEADETMDPKEVHILPLVSVEMGSEQLPHIIKEGSFSNLASAYPIVDDTPKIPYGKQIFDRLYKKLKRDSKFKLLFEYIFPSKRLLALNTILNTENFEQFFTNRCAFQSIFNSTKRQLGNILELAEQGGGVDIGEPQMPDVTEALGQLGTDVFPDGAYCPPNVAALGNYLTPPSPRIIDVIAATSADSEE